MMCWNMMEARLLMIDNARLCIYIRTKPQFDFVTSRSCLFFLRNLACSFGFENLYTVQTRLFIMLFDE